MPKVIAVYVGENGKTASLHEAGKVVIYRRRQGKWDVLKEREISLEASGPGLPQLRKKMAQILEFLDECRVFVGLSVTGVPYFELEKAGCSVWEVEGTPSDFLDYVLKEEEKVRRQELSRRKGGNSLAPVEIAGGHYRISLQDIQENSTGVTSKQVLLPFLREKQFYALDIFCSHVPPWLEMELAAGNFCGEIRKTAKDEIQITITGKCCNQP